VAFYAAQSFEEAPELPRPEDAPQVPANCYGLLSYTLTAALTQRQSPLTYRELCQMVVARYRADRKSRPPTPFAEGDLDREVLGMNIWPRSSVILTRSGGMLTVNAGELAGLIRGSVLAVYPPGGDPQPAQGVIGHLRVVEVNPLSARVLPTGFEQSPPVGPDDLPERSRCEPATRDLGDLRLKVAIVAPTPSDTRSLRTALQGLPEPIAELIQFVDDPGKAEWWLLPEGDQVILKPGEGHPPGTLRGAQPRPSVLERYPRNEQERLISRVCRDFQRIYKWQNLWRIAGAVGDNPPPGRDLGLRLEVKTLKGPEDAQGRPLVEHPTLTPGQRLEVRLINNGDRDLWVSLLALDGRFGIQAIPIVSIQAGASTSPGRLEVTDDAFGNEGLIALAIPIEASKDRPDLSFLEQERLGQPGDDGRQRGSPPKSLFDRLLRAAAFGGRSRGIGIRRDLSLEPQVVSASWITKPLLKQ